MFLLLTELKKLFETGFQGVNFAVSEARPARFRPPGVHIGALPARPSTGEKEEYPFIVHRIVTGQDDQNSADATVNTVCGIWTPDTEEAGENEILNMVARGRGLILQNQTLDDTYRLELPMKWTLGLVSDQFVQPHPFYGGIITTKWEIPTYEKTLLTEELESYGYLR